MLLKWGGGDDYAEGEGSNTISVTCPQGGKYAGGGRGKYAVTQAHSPDTQN